MKIFWHKAFKVYFEKVICSTMSRFSEIESFFQFEGIKPIGIGSLILEMAQEKDFLILKGEHEILKVNHFLGYNQNQLLTKEILQQILSFFKISKTKINPDDIILDVNFFKHLYEDCRGKLPIIFENDLILEKKIFENRSQSHFQIKNLDKQAILFLLKYNKSLLFLNENQVTFYYLPFEKDL